ncbi:ADP-ribose pyrophosphatase, mitochondrial isoform X2 [Aplysia californica]|uniref:ADP-ribose pyrophosphatase, mitochondrial isoform X2 n=1 Tax=Aplysia californica TaxID=6500 RepID=A0ABM0JHQ8_APLCA|nr:ADP-ribose pyrophosphatase, mitochondrial isoform X2 [Aplysia californica]
MGNLISRRSQPASSSVDGISFSKPRRTQSGTHLGGKGRRSQHQQQQQSSGGDGARPRSLSLPGNPSKEAAVAIMKTHVKARCEVYPRGDIKRFLVPDDKVSWDELFPEYAPVEYTSPSVLQMPPWADVDFRHTVTNGDDTSSPHSPKWNQLDGKVNRRSHMGSYQIYEKVPRNPVGRTGMIGRGTLGRWGPNHAADPIVTRWKRDDNGKVVKDANGKQILEFIAVQRRDNGEWALPGGMVDAGEVVSITLKREFGEEALNSLEANDADKKAIEASINDLFMKGVEVYRGYVDDPRNTDNSWMETVAMNFHDAEGTGVAKFKLHAGDDAVGVQWMELSHDLKLYASHINFLQTTAEKLGAHW